jgi:hypothetical protein
MKPLATVVLNKDQLEILINLLRDEIRSLDATEKELAPLKDLHMALEMASSELDH